MYPDLTIRERVRTDDKTCSPEKALAATDTETEKLLKMPVNLRIVAISRLLESISPNECISIPYSVKKQLSGSIELLSRKLNR